MTSARPTGSRPHVAIVGAGFAGLEAARALAGAPCEVTVVDRRNHHLFQPLLYQVATAALSGADIAVPIRWVLRRQKNVTVLLDEVTRVDVEARRLELRNEEALPYDYLILATGASHAYFGHDGWRAWAPGLKTLSDALDIRRRILLAFEAAEREEDPGRERRDLTFVVVGGGPTGVELAGAIREIAVQTLASDFRHFDAAQARVVLVEAGPRLLAAFPEELSEEARLELESLGVEVRLHTAVTDVTADGVKLGEEELAAQTVLWAAGVEASPVGRTLGAPTDRAGRVKVAEDLSVPGHPEIFVVGDLAAVTSGGAPVPGVAPAAIQAGRQAARNIRAELAGRARAAFVYRDKGSLATIGRRRAVAALGRSRFSGLFAWLLWLFVHVMTLVGFRNRVAVLFNWAFVYLMGGRGSRIVLEGTPELVGAEAATRVPAGGDGAASSTAVGAAARGSVASPPG